MHKIVSLFHSQIKHLTLKVQRPVRLIEGNCRRLAALQSEFWEDTDRGNMNMYYTADTHYIPHFLELFNQQMAEHTHHI